MARRGQTTIFVIVGILIVVVGILIYAFFPQIKTTISGEIVPNTYLQQCIKPTVDSGIETLSEQGGYAKPEGYILYGGKQVKYLCYNSQYYKTCLVQQPLIKKQFENELNEIVKSQAEDCIEQMKAVYEKKGYDVSTSSKLETDVEIIPEKIRIRIDAPMQIKKESTQSFSEFNVEMPSKMYDLLMISTSLVDYESTYGDSATDLYLMYYPNIRIEKTKLIDGSTIYKLSDVTTKEQFMFASRSLAWPAAYGFEK